LCVCGCNLSVYYNSNNEKKVKCYYKAQHGNHFVVIAGHDNNFKGSILLMAHLKFFQVGWDLAITLTKICAGRTGKLGHSLTKHLSV